MRRTGLTLLVICLLSLNGCMVIFQKGRRSDIEKIQTLESELEELRKARDILRKHLSSEIDAQKVRLNMAERLNLVPVDRYDFLWVTSFPLVEFDDDEGRYQAVHHPFTSPLYDDLDMLDESPEKVRSRSYDLVLNGVELGSGSIRIHKKELQNKVFSILGISEREAENRFGFFLDALQYGAPPHGGIALGLDRFLMILANASSLRDVIAFPKTTKAACLMTGSPSPVDHDQLKELHLQLEEENI